MSLEEKNTLCKGMNQYKAELLDAMFEKKLVNEEIVELMHDVAIDYVHKVYES